MPDRHCSNSWDSCTPLKPSMVHGNLSSPSIAKLQSMILTITSSFINKHEAVSVVHLNFSYILTTILDCSLAACCSFLHVNRCLWMDCTYIRWRNGLFHIHFQWHDKLHSGNGLDKPKTKSSSEWLRVQRHVYCGATLGKHLQSPQNISWCDA